MQLQALQADLAYEAQSPRKGLNSALAWLIIVMYSQGFEVHLQLLSIVASTSALVQGGMCCSAVETFLCIAPASMDRHTRSQRLVLRAVVLYILSARQGMLFHVHSTFGESRGLSGVLL